MFEMLFHAYATVKTLISLVHIHQSKVLTGHGCFIDSRFCKAMSTLFIPFSFQNRPAYQ